MTKALIAVSMAAFLIVPNAFAANGFSPEVAGKNCLATGLDSIHKNVKVISAKLPQIDQSQSKGTIRVFEGEIDVVLGADGGVKATYQYSCYVDERVWAAKPELIIRIVR